MRHRLALALLATGASAWAQDLDMLKLERALSDMDSRRADLAGNLEGLKSQHFMSADSLAADFAHLATLKFLAQDVSADARRADNAYQSGKRALDRDKFEEAIQRFNSAIDATSPNADGAYYWKAYALHRLHRSGEALEATAQLRAKFPQSRWLKDAQALEIEIKQDQGKPVDPATESNEELKLIALTGLMQSDPERAVPILRKVLTSNQSPAIKDKAMFVLSQSGSPDARKILLDIAGGKADPDLQEKAIRYIGMMGSSEMRGELTRIYAATDDVNVKRQIIRSYLISGSKPELLQAAKGEKNPELRKEAIRTLAQSGGKDEIWMLYKQETTNDLKAEIIRAMLIEGDSGHLLEIARTEKDPQIRKEAIRTLAMTGWGKDTPALVEMYRGEQDDSVKHEIVRGMFIQQNSKGLVDLARSEKNPDLRREIVQQLSLIHSKESTDFMLELLSK